MRGIGKVKAEILDRLLRVMAQAGAVAYVPSLYACIEARLWALAAIDTAALAAFIAAARARRASPEAKLVFLVGASLAVAAAVLYSTGPFGAGYVWLLCAAFAAALLGTSRILAATTVLATAILAAYGLLIGLGRAPVGQPILTLVVISANLLLVGSLVASTARRLIKGLERAYEGEQRLAARLGEELEAARAADLALRSEMDAKEALLKELNHRVRNNMQVVASLLRIEGGSAPDSGGADRMERRVRALSLANELFLADPAAERIELRALVAGAAESVRASCSYEGEVAVRAFSRLVPAEFAASLAIAAAEIVMVLAEDGKRVEAGLERRGGREVLSFEWECGPASGDEDVGARLASAPIIAALAPWGAVFEPAAPCGRARLSLGLPTGA